MKRESRRTESGGIEWVRPCEMCLTEGFWDPDPICKRQLCPGCREKFEARRKLDFENEALFKEYLNSHPMIFSSLESRERFKEWWLIHRERLSRKRS